MEVSSTQKYFFLWGLTLPAGIATVVVMDITDIYYISLIFAYFVFAMYVVLATYLNLVLRAWRQEKWKISTGWAWFYVIVWAIVFTAPIAYGMVTA